MNRPLMNCFTSRTTWLFAALSMFALVSYAPAAEPLSFNRDVRPILSGKCFSCHGPDANQRQAELRLDVEDAAKESAIVSGQPDDSELVARILSDDADSRMPPDDSGKKLSAEEIETLRRWITQGAPYEKHWAFIPPRRPEPPDAPDAVRVANPIDRFVADRLIREGLEQSPRGDRYALLRRVALDLTGLPPTPAQIHTFVNDQSPDAWESAVDRLFASDGYGEHMARYWMDAARYADTNGYQYDLEREQWVWRDWVIHAFNSNMPYDRFTIEQIAGDLLPEATDQQILATAFHRNHPITIEGGVIDEEYRTEYVVDRVVTTSTVWLGLTMICGRCHDHKYDPIEQREFYQFFAFFNQVAERGLQGFDPKREIHSPLRDARSRQLELELAAANTRLDALLDMHADQFSDWERQLTRQARDPWSIMVPPSRTSQGGAQLEVQEDQSILAKGANPAVETYELVLDSESPVYAVRVEALTDKSLAGQGTGRASNGNFVLSEFQLAGSKNASPDEFRKLEIASAEADYSQQNYPIAHAIDGKIDRTGWAVDGNTKQENRFAVFHLAKPWMPDGAARLRIRLHHAWGGSHSIGRFRIALAARPVATVPADIAGVIGKDSKQRSREETSRLKRYLVTRFAPTALQSAGAQVDALQKRIGQTTRVPATMVMADRGTPRATHVLFRGEYDKPRGEVAPGTPAALPPMPKGAPANRLGLARWMVMPENPLTARVAVNRFWQQLFGVGLVKSAEDFGAQGDWPSHPELLDWLAVDFVESGWDVKRMLKLIVTSETYRQSSRLTPELAERDADNRLLSRGPMGRLDAEVIRDSALLAGGLLSGEVGGPSVFPYQPAGLWQEINNRPGYSRTYRQDSGDKLYRRSLYTFWKRTAPPPSMAAFDAPQREYCVVRRSRTNTPLQAFVMLHDPQFVEAARHVGRRMMADGGKTTRDRIRHGFLLTVSRPPNEREQQLLQAVFTQRMKRYQAQPQAAKRLLAVGDSAQDDTLDPVELAAWATVGRVLLNLSEFVTKP